MNSCSTSTLRKVFILGGLIDGLIAISWLLISLGVSIPNILNGHTGSGTDYELAMLVSAMFMAAWTILLFWGAQKADERKGLLLITAICLLLSICIELLLYRDVLGGGGFIFGALKRSAIAALMMFVYVKSELTKR